MNKRLIIEIKNGSELTRNDPGGPRQTVRGMEFRVGENARNLTASAGHLFPCDFLKDANRGSTRSGFSACMTR